MKAKIKANVRSDENSSGLLTKKKEQYLNCFMIDYQKLERFYREDKAEWDDNLKTIKKEANKNRDQIEDLINKYSLELQALLSQNNTLELPTPGQEDKFTLRKLPFWGKEPSKSERNKFEWPTRDLQYLS